MSMWRMNWDLLFSLLTSKPKLMKNLLKLLTISTLVSCAGKEEKLNSNILENLSFTVDTVLMDAG